jgi:RHS repeat-associated protein
VYAWWTANPNRATNATYTVAYSGGTAAVTVNQQTNGGAWNLLGTYTFGSGTGGNITLTDQANGYVIADATRLVPVQGQAQPAVYYIVPDHLNTPRLIANQQGTTVWKWDQTEPFGVTQPNTDPDGDGVTFDFPLRFPGQYFDRETNLAYNYYRDYDFSIGRYTQSDPVGLAGGFNGYLYVDASPIMIVDPSGLAPPCIYMPDDFDTTNCVLLSRVAKDKPLTDWRPDEPIVINTWTIPLPNFGFGIRWPNKKLALPKPSTGRTRNYGEIQWGFFEVERLYRADLLIVEEEWMCCGTKKARTISCTSDWTQTDIIKHELLPSWRYYQKRL